MAEYVPEAVSLTPIETYAWTRSLQQVCKHWVRRGPEFRAEQDPIWAPQDARSVTDAQMQVRPDVWIEQLAFRVPSFQDVCLVLGGRATDAGRLTW